MLAHGELGAFRIVGGERVDDLAVFADGAVDISRG
jgi:hypothetical protein